MKPEIVRNNIKANSDIGDYLFERGNGQMVVMQVVYEAESIDTVYRISCKNTYRVRHEYRYGNQNTTLFDNLLKTQEELMLPINIRFVYEQIISQVINGKDPAETTHKTLVKLRRSSLTNS